MGRPAPASARLVGAAASRPPKPPFGLSGWSEDGEATVVLLDGSQRDLASPDAVAAPIPASAAFGERTLVVVLGAPEGGRGTLRRILSMGLARPATVPRSVRCSALVARGYVDVEAARDEASSHDLTWGWSERQNAVS